MKISTQERIRIMLEKMFMYGLEKISDSNRKKERYALLKLRANVNTIQNSVKI